MDALRETGKKLNIPDAEEAKASRLEAAKGHLRREHIIAIHPHGASAHLHGKLHSGVKRGGEKRTELNCKVCRTMRASRTLDRNENEKGAHL